jgi:uncharacterized protein
MYNERQADQIGVVLDTSVIVSGFRSARGASSEILRLWRDQRSFQLIFSDSTLIELTETLLEKLVPETVIKSFLEMIHRQALITDNAYIVQAVAADPNDDIFLATALEGRADFVVSLDRHLLAIKQYQSVRIIWPRDFLQIIRSLNT